MSVMLLTGHHLEFLSLQGDCADSFESTLVKIPDCWKSHVMAHILIYLIRVNPNCNQIFKSYLDLEVTDVVGHKENMHLS